MTYRIPIVAGTAVDRLAIRSTIQRIIRWTASRINLGVWLLRAATVAGLWVLCYSITAHGIILGCQVGQAVGARPTRITDTTTGETVAATIAAARDEHVALDVARGIPELILSAYPTIQPATFPCEGVVAPVRVLSCHCRKLQHECAQDKNGGARPPTRPPRHQVHMISAAVSRCAHRATSRPGATSAPVRLPPMPREAPHTQGTPNQYFFSPTVETNSDSENFSLLYTFLIGNVFNSLKLIRRSVRSFSAPRQAGAEAFR